MAASNMPMTDLTAPWRLLRWAIDELVATTRTSPQPFNPLCLITADAATTILGDIAGLTEAAGLTVLRRSGRELGEELERAISTDSEERLRDRFAAADLVVVDALETIGAGDRQAGACQVFDVSTEARTAWCVSLSRPPEAAGFDPCLASRLSGGLLITLPTRVIPSLKGPPRISKIIAATARQFDLSVADITGGRRSRNVAGARSLAMYLARTLTGASFNAIGKACGGRDHTTAMHATRKIAAEINRNTGLAEEVAAITARIA